MKSRHRLLALLLPVVFACTSFGARAQDAAPTLASLAAQVGALGRELRQVSALAVRQQQALADLRAENAAVVSKLGCVLKFSGSRDFVFDGCNVQIRNGAGSTKTTNRYGNLIIGYNKNEVATRLGSHNLVLGDLHEYSSYGGIVTGELNTLAGPNTTILSSSESSANASGSALVGANKGITDGPAVIVGGVRGYASAAAQFGVVVGGTENSATGNAAVAVGGTMNTASGSNALTCGGSENAATSSSSTACGGSRNQSTALESTVTGGSQNNAAGRASSVTGGLLCNSGVLDDKWVVGLQAFPGGCSAFAN